MNNLVSFLEGSNLYPISDVAKNEWLDFAMYTVEARAIPNMIDGLKPVQRFYLYSSIKNSKKDFKKVSAVSGIISDYGYNHGEQSAAGAGQLMAATWNNNITLVEGRGSFGTRLIQEAGAPRYVYTRLSENFDKYIKDINLAPEHGDPEHEPPAFYVPIIPLVLVNGTKGIATGFATHILPRHPGDLITACQQYLSTGKIKVDLRLKFPEFKGTVSKDLETNGKYHVEGVWSKKGKTTLMIEEVPYGFDRESYVKILDSLEDDGDIVSYEDLCDKDGFKFDVKLKQQTSAKWTSAKLVSKFKLSKPLTENLTVIDFNGKLREYKDPKELIKDFCDYRLGVLQKRIDIEVQKYKDDIRWLSIRLMFIEAIRNKEIDIMNMGRQETIKATVKVTGCDVVEVGKLISMPIQSIMKSEPAQFKKKITETKKILKFWESTTPADQFTSDLKGIL